MIPVTSFFKQHFFKKKIERNESTHEILERKKY